MNRSEYYMNRALELASLGKGRVSPNPIVGAVLVYNDQVIGEGYHTGFGQPHAEAEAIQRVSDASLLPYSTLYINLEPCSHHGKTPPCADLIIQHQIPEVVIACTDESAEVDGKGLKKLKEAEIKVTTGILEQEARFLNRRFFTFHQKQRPYVILKWAQTANGFIADKNGHSKWISNPFSRMYVHKWRSEESAIMAGTQTALTDNPRLTARNWKGKNPLRVVLDKTLKLDQQYHLYDQEATTWLLNYQKEETEGNPVFVKMDFGKGWLEVLLKRLWENKHNSLFVEGGAQLLNTFIEAGLWDEARIFTNPGQNFMEGIKAPLLNAGIASTTCSGSDVLNFYYNQKTMTQ